MRRPSVLIIAALAVGCARAPVLRPTPDTPRFPDILRRANVEGMTTFRVAVSPSGRADTASLRVLWSTHELFSNALRRALPNLEWHPARNWLGRQSASEHTYVVRWKLMRGATRDNSLAGACPTGAGDTTVVCAPELILRPGECAFTCGYPTPIIAEVEKQLGMTATQRASALAELDGQQARWHARHPWSYRYSESASCFGVCTLSNGSRTRTVTVRSGRSSSIDTLFAQIATAMRDTAFQAVKVRYDSLYGYPREVTFDRDLLVNDDEFRRTVGALTVLQATRPPGARKKDTAKP
jgi:hypothetical protein